MLTFLHANGPIANELVLKFWTSGQDRLTLDADRSASQAAHSGRNFSTGHHIKAIVKVSQPLKYCHGRLKLMLKKPKPALLSRLRCSV